MADPPVLRCCEECPVTCRNRQARDAHRRTCGVWNSHRRAPPPSPERPGDALGGDAADRGEAPHAAGGGGGGDGDGSDAAAYNAAAAAGRGADDGDDDGDYAHYSGEDRDAAAAGVGDDDAVGEALAAEIAAGIDEGELNDGGGIGEGDGRHGDGEPADGGPDDGARDGGSDDGAEDDGGDAPPPDGDEGGAPSADLDALEQPEGGGGGDAGGDGSGDAALAAAAAAEAAWRAKVAGILLPAGYTDSAVDDAAAARYPLAMLRVLAAKAFHLEMAHLRYHFHVSMDALHYMLSSMRGRIFARAAGVADGSLSHLPADGRTLIAAVKAVQRTSQGTLPEVRRFVIELTPTAGRPSTVPVAALDAAAAARTLAVSSALNVPGSWLSVMPAAAAADGWRAVNAPRTQGVVAAVLAKRRGAIEAAVAASGVPAERVRVEPVLLFVGRDGVLTSGRGRVSADVTMMTVENVADAARYSPMACLPIGASLRLRTGGIKVGDKTLALPAAVVRALHEGNQTAMAYDLWLQMAALEEAPLRVEPASVLRGASPAQLGQCTHVVLVYVVGTLVGDMPALYDAMGVMTSGCGWCHAKGAELAVATTLIGGAAPAAAPRTTAEAVPLFRALRDARLRGNKEAERKAVQALHALGLRDVVPSYLAVYGRVEITRDLHSHVWSDLLHTISLGPAKYAVDIVFIVLAAVGGAAGATAVGLVERRVAARASYDDGVVSLSSVKDLSTASKLTAGELRGVLPALAAALTPDVVPHARTREALRELVLVTAALAALASMRTSAPAVVAHAMAAARLVLRGLRRFDAARDTTLCIKPHLMQHLLRAWVQNGCPVNHDTQKTEAGNRSYVNRLLGRSSNHRSAPDAVMDNAAVAAVMHAVMPGLRGVGAVAGLQPPPPRDYAMRGLLTGRPAARVQTLLSSLWADYVALVAPPSDGAAAAPPPALACAAVHAYSHVHYVDGDIDKVIRPGDVVLLTPIDRPLETATAAVVVAFASVDARAGDGLGDAGGDGAAASGAQHDDGGGDVPAGARADLRKVIVVHWLLGADTPVAAGRVAGTTLVERRVAAWHAVVSLSTLARPFPHFHVCKPGTAVPDPGRVQLWDAPRVFVPTTNPAADAADSGWTWSQPTAAAKRAAAKAGRSSGRKRKRDEDEDEDEDGGDGGDGEEEEGESDEPYVARHGRGAGAGAAARPRTRAADDDDDD